MCTIQQFSDQLATVVDDSKSCYLMPVSPVFPTLDDSDSFCTNMEMSRAGYRTLMGFQDVDPISVKGLVETQKTLKRNIPLRKALKSIQSGLYFSLFPRP